MKLINSFIVVSVVGLVGFLIPTILIDESVLFADNKLGGLFYEQIIGLFFGIISGILLVEAYDERARWDNFSAQVKQQTFSFAGFALSFIVFCLQVIFPKVGPAQAMRYVTPQGKIVLPADSTMFSFALILSALLFFITVAFLLKFLYDKKKR